METRKELAHRLITEVIITCTLEDFWNTWNSNPHNQKLSQYIKKVIDLKSDLF